MKYLAAVSLVITMIALPACAQRGAAHGGFSGHAAGASRGGFSASAPARSSGYRGSAAPRSLGVNRGFQRGAAGSPLARSPYTGSWRYRRPYAPGYRAGYPYIYPGYGWVSPYSLGYPYGDGYDDSSAPPDNGSGYAPEEYEAEPDQGQYQQQQPPLASWQPAPEAARPAPSPASEEAVTLIFKDGRPAEHIHNYLLTPSTLYVGDQHHRAIPTEELDLVATAKANQDAGVDFQLPNGTR